MPHLSLCVLGSFQADLDGTSLTALKSNKVRALLAYLAVECERPHPRETLAGLLWPELPESAALANLRDALANLRRNLQEEQQASPLIAVTAGSLQFNAQGDCWVDALAFADLTRQRSGPMTQTSEPQALEQALALVQGDFLEGFWVRDSAPFEEWQLLKREQIQRQVTVLLYQLAGHYTDQGAYAQAATHLRRLLHLAPYDDEACQRLMWVLALDGKRGEALAHYQACHDLLDRDLGVAPAAETTVLYRRIRDGEIGKLGNWGFGKAGPATRMGSAEGVGFVGREEELARLAAWLDATLAGQGRVALVAGEAGSGKTALLEALAARAVAAHGALVVARGRCNAHAGAGDPYLPFREILQALTGDVEGQRAAGSLPGEQARRLWALLPTTAQALAAHGPDLIDTFIPGAALLQRVEAFAPWNSAWHTRLRALAERPRPPDTRAGRRQAALFTQVTAVLSAVARRAPLLLLVDDLHWADGGTTALLFHLGRRLAGSPILIAGAYRPSALNLIRNKPVDDRRESHPLALVIDEFGRAWGEASVDLDQADGRCFVDALLDAEPNHLDAPFRERLYRHTGGNALFAVELLRSFRRQGVLVQDETGCWIEGPDLDWSHSPGQVQAVLAGQMNALPAGDRALLDAASVQGETFVAEVAARALNTDAAEVARQLSGPLARQQRLVSAAGLEWVTPEAIPPSEAASPLPQPLSHYRFRHILVQDYLYHQIDEVARARLHAATGQAIEALCSPDPAALALQAGQLARHFAAAGQPFRAAEYHLRAAEEALRLSASEETIAHLRQGLALLSALPDSPARARLEMELSLALNTPLVFTRGFGSAEQVQAHEQLYHLCQHPTLANSPHRTMALTLVAYAAAWSADTARAVRIGRQLLDLAQATGHAQRISLAHWVLGTAYLFASEMKSAREHLDLALASYDPALPGLPGWPYQVDPGVFSSILRAQLLWMQGYPDQARRDLEAASRLTQRLAHPPSQALARFVVAATLYHLGRDVAPMARLVQIPLRPDETTEVLDGLRDLLAARQQAETMASREPAGDGESQANDVLLEGQAGVELFHAVGPQVGNAPLLLILADGYALAGRSEPALNAVEQALRLIERTSVRLYEPEAYRVLGELLLMHGEPAAAAEDCFKRAIDVAHRLDQRWWELRATVSLARLWAIEGRREQAHALLDAVYGWFTEGFDTPDLVEARALLAALQ
ncbi:MAG: AAA family ATPase [Anaerolineae bacterium]|nr:AAA family ATPase [Anaerolineae bacterium]